LQECIERESSFVDALTMGMNHVIVGQKHLIESLLIGLLADGHILLEGVPGLAKTLAINTLAKLVKADFSRIQFTPDLLPADVIGTQIYSQKTEDFKVKKGPIFANFVLADEINRATPRTQSSLLECMEEKQVTIDGEKYVLEEPFLVVATQNPIETAGTFQLPEAQMDRFMMKLSMGFLRKSEEIKVLSCYLQEDPLDKLTKVLEVSDIVAMQKEVNEVYVHSSILEYITSIVEATRRDTGIVMGVSTRGSLALLKAAKAYAYIQGRNYVVPEDVKTLAIPVLAHRMVLNFGYHKETDSKQKLKEILDKQAVPTEEFDKK
jgi:MoxR-like ATPase